MGYMDMISYDALSKRCSKKWERVCVQRLVASEDWGEWKQREVINNIYGFLLVVMKMFNCTVLWNAKKQWIVHFKGFILLYLIKKHLKEKGYGLWSHNSPPNWLAMLAQISHLTSLNFCLPISKMDVSLDWKNCLLMNNLANNAGFPTHWFPIPNSY